VLNHVLQLTHIAGPAIGLQEFLCSVNPLFRRYTFLQNMS
jgi:hypothetical protein